LRTPIECALLAPASGQPTSVEQSLKTHRRKTQAKGATECTERRREFTERLVEIGHHMSRRARWRWLDGQGSLIICDSLTSRLLSVCTVASCCSHVETTDFTDGTDDLRRVLKPHTFPSPIVRNGGPGSCPAAIVERHVSIGAHSRRCGSAALHSQTNFRKHAIGRTAPSRGFLRPGFWQGETTGRTGREETETRWRYWRPRACIARGRSGSGARLASSAVRAFAATATYAAAAFPWPLAERNGRHFTAAVAQGAHAASQRWKPAG